MPRRTVSPCGVILVLALASCTPPDIHAAWPAPRPLDQDMSAYQPPPQPPVEARPVRELREPTGVLTLPQAQALALLQNPKLAAFGWEVRAREAQILQAGLRPNPEVEVEVENFAGSGALQAFRGTEITILLSQLIELAGKRHKRARVAALERIVLPNPNGHWRPGLFVTGHVVVKDTDVPLLVPKTALQTLEERPTVFVETAEGWKPQPVTLGRSNDTHVEITAGLTPGQRYVTSGAFTLKAQLSKGAFSDGHGH